MTNQNIKQFFLTLIALFFFTGIFAQFTATGTYKSYANKYPGIDYFFVFNGINAQTAIIYNGTYTQIKWYRFDNQTTELLLQTPNENYNIEDGTGYICEVDGVKKSIWVVDYSKYLVSNLSLLTELNPTNQCDGLKINVQGSVLPITYRTPAGLTKTAERLFNLKYTSKEWKDAKWADKEEISEVVMPNAVIQVENPPLCDTKFTLEGDNFATDLGLEPYSVESDLYLAVKPVGHITSTASIRTEKNEGDLPENATVTTASAPLEVVFASNANVPVTQFYTWQIFKDKALIITRNDQDLRFNFVESGNYNVKLTTSNSYCESEDSIQIKIVESVLQIPKVFTPNGDQINDEFRVAYKSIVEFRAWIFNRWQQKIFYWTDPQKGWDGTINGRPAAPGAYFYLIEAVGADGVIHKEKGHFSLLRGKKD